MEDPNRFTDDDREAVLTALAEEVRLKHEGKPYSEAVIMACEVCLRVNVRKPSVEPPHYTMPPERPLQTRYMGQIHAECDCPTPEKCVERCLAEATKPEPIRYWWQDKD